MTSTSGAHDRPEADTPGEGDDVVHDILELFNAEDLIDDPDGPHDPPASPASDADAPAPPG